MALLLTDQTSNGNTLTAVNTPTENTSSLPFSTNNVRTATLVRASHQYFTGVDAASLRPTRFTIEAWVKLTANTNYHTIFTSWSQNTHAAGFLLYVNGSNYLVLDIGNNTGDEVPYADNTVVADGAWHHVAVTYDGSNITFFVDSVQKTQTANTTDPVFAATNYIRIGSQTNAGTDFTSSQLDGYIDDVRLYNVARTQTQIASDYYKELVGNEANLVAYWPFETSFKSNLLNMFK